jgi:phosphatidylglycerol:prolipoprotein diacylglycerol transferase
MYLTTHYQITKYLTPYNAATVIAFLTGLLLLLRADKRRTPSLGLDWTIILWVWLASTAGARIYWTLQYGDMDNLINFAWVQRSGKVFYGGLIGGFLGGAMYCRLKGINFLDTLDLVVPYLALGEAIVRIGCFFNGCCWGAPTHWPWAISYPRSHHGVYAQQLRDGLIPWHAKHSLPVHPVQIYATLTLVVVFITLIYIRPLRQARGNVLIAYFTLYGFTRFLLEELRADCPRYPPFDWSLSQIIALIMGVSALIFWAIRTKGKLLAEY